MRVVLISKAYVLATYRRKAEELAALGLEVTLVAPPCWRDERGVTRFEPGAARGYDLAVLPIALNGHYHLHWNRDLGGLIRRLRPDIVHIEEEPYNLATFVAVAAARRVGAAPVFFTWQNLARRYPPPFSWIERYVYRHAAHAIAGNRDAVGVMRAKGYAGPATVIPQFGVDPEQFPPRPREPGEFTIGYVGRLVPEKGVDILLRAAASPAVADRAPWRLLVLGSGPELPRLRALADRLGIGERTAFLDPIPSSELARHLHRLSCLVLPSRSLPNWREQFGRVLTEAMSCGVPVIGSSCGEIPHVIGEAGLVFPEGDHEALARAIAGLMADAGLRERLSRQGRERLLSCFTQSGVARATLDVYRHALSPMPREKAAAAAVGAEPSSR